MDAMEKFAFRNGHAISSAQTYGREIRMMVEYIANHKSDAAWALNRIALACDALSRIESTAEIALERHLANQAKKVA